MPVVVTHELLTFNAFGIITITPKKILVDITAVSGSHAVKRSVSKALSKPLPEVGDRTVAASYGAMITPGEKTRITVSEVGTSRLSEPLADIPEVSRLLEQAIGLIERSSFNS